MSSHYTVIVRIVQVVDNEEVTDSYGKVKTPARKFDREDGNFTVRADSRDKAIQQALAHLKLELPNLHAFQASLDKELNGL